MSDDDGGHLDPEPGPGARKTRFRVGCLIALLAVLFFGGYALAGVLVGKDGAQSSMLGRVALSAGAAAGLLAAGWATILVGRRNWCLWRLWARGEVVRGTIVELATEPDYDGDVRIRARVRGRTRHGWTFDRWLLVGYHGDPGFVGGPIDVRYHAGLRQIDRVERGLGGLVTNAVTWLLTVGALAILLWILAFLCYGLVLIWTSPR